MTKINAQFWVGKFKNEYLFNDFFKENYFDDDNEPISKFAKSQDELWIDHDFIEKGFEDNLLSKKEKFKDFSYYNNWINFLENRLFEKNINDLNFIVLVFYDDNKPRIISPKSYKESDVEIIYIGSTLFQT